MIRGKGSVKEGKVGRKDGQMLPGEDEPLHALVTANTMENVKKAVEQVIFLSVFVAVVSVTWPYNMFLETSCWLQLACWPEFGQL